MKTIKTLLIIFLAGIIFSGCKEKKEGVEVVPSLEQTYLSDAQVDVPVNEKIEYDIRDKKDILDALKPMVISKPHSQTNYKIAIRLFINEKGAIDKIQDIGSYILTDDSSIIINRQSTISKIINSIAQHITDWKFIPAIKKGEPVKSRKDLNINYISNPDGSFNTNFGFGAIASSPGINDFIPVDKIPQVINTISPHYPELARKAGIEGTAYVKVLVNTEGNPQKAVVIKSDNEIFNQTSIDAAMQFKFTSAEKDNKPVAVWVVIPFRYRLDGSKGELMHYKDLKKMPPKK